ncbi:MAG: response regulator [Endomicrobium sp.]|nr:response regulator [Endomicrobium sp.]
MQRDKKPNYEGKCILVAEDTEINKEIIKAFLQNTKVKIDFAVNGMEAVDKFKEDPDRYGLILMDVQMPKMDGLEATRRIRALDCKRAKSIPIIALTANIFNEDIEECLAAGMNSHIGKPIEMDSMFVTLRQYMPENHEGSEPDYSSFLPYIDVKEGLEMVVNDKELYFQLLSSFDGKKLADKLIDDINNKDYESASVIVHTIKGIAANLGLTALRDLSKKIESLSKLGKDVSVYIDDIAKTTNKTLDLITGLTNNQKI